MEKSEVYQERLKVLTERRAEVEAQRDTLARECAKLVKAGQDTGDRWAHIQACEQELHMLDREITEVGNLAADRWATERLWLDREEFQAANRSLSGKRSMLPRVRSEAVAQISAAADKLRQYIRELDELEGAQSAKAAELNRTAETLGFAPDLAVPAKGAPESFDRAAGVAVSRLLQQARRGNRRDYLLALAGVVFELS